jgi:hypothetical protein
MRDFDIQQVIPAPGWRWCVVMLDPDDPDDEIDFEIGSVVAIAVGRDRDAAPDDPTIVVPLILDLKDGATFVPFDPLDCTYPDEKGFLIDPVWDDAQIYDQIAHAVDLIRSALGSRNAPPTGVNRAGEHR